MDALDRAVGRVIRETDAACFGTSQYDRLMEKWSDAARAASAAARRAKGSGGNWRKAARTAFAGSKSGRGKAVYSVKKNLKKAVDFEQKADADPRNTSGYRWKAGGFEKRALTKANRFGAENSFTAKRGNKKSVPTSKGGRRVRRSIDNAIYRS